MNIDYAKWIGDISTLDVCVGVAAVASFVMSLYELVSRKIHQKTKVSLYVDLDAGFDLCYACALNKNDVAFCVPCLFVNDADSDIAIVKIELLTFDDTLIKCSQREESFYTYLDPKPYGPVAKSVRFPINLMRKQGSYGVLRFILPVSDSCPKIQKVFIHTNKRTVQDKQFTKNLNSAIAELYKKVD